MGLADACAVGLLCSGKATWESAAMSTNTELSEALPTSQDSEGYTDGLEALGINTEADPKRAG